MASFLENPTTLRRIALGVIVLLALLSLLHVLKASPFVPIFHQTQASTTQSVELSQPDIAVAQAKNLFGEIPKVAVAPKPKPVTKPKPKPAQKPKKQPLNIRVMGLIASANPQMNYAIIQEGGKKQKLYGLDEAVENTDARIKSIDEEKVVFDRDGAEETAYLVKPQATGNITGGAQNRSRNNSPTSLFDDPLDDPFAMPSESIQAVNPQANFGGQNSNTASDFIDPFDPEFDAELLDSPEVSEAEKQALKRERERQQKAWEEEEARYVGFENGNPFDDDNLPFNPSSSEDPFYDPAMFDDNINSNLGN